ncbi:hypothetical protein PF003_g13755 [Phytophthora fragariae]|nr:hypothetical protein PF003_g13755 [Phytophthora fragariae]
MSLSFRPANGGLSPPVQRLIAGAYPPPNAKLFLLTMRFQLADIAQRYPATVAACSGFRS